MKSKSFVSASTLDLLKLAGRALSLEDTREARSPMMNFFSKHADIVRLLKQGQSIRHAGKITGKGFSTVQRVKKILDQQQVLFEVAPFFRPLTG